ncbi:acetate kinase [Nocardioides albertanoniae]|uniref:Acetate kinase n=1 Tax=Nocardioides albertanoniae TaxID=1175486 RepID=A0A543A8V9_9ACTN|nr:acetate/propionate family kinase [Nocardioides albertanoniae]TQL68940.1 acetate kinase [Nocardioides albertanoniae]
MRILTVNAGSSSLKLSVMDRGCTLRSTTVEHWEGEEHLDPLRDFLHDEATSREAVGHRVVHGGPELADATMIDDAALARIEAASDLAPLHNNRSLAGIRATRRLAPDLPAVACFDTSLHADLPVAARTYALPREWNRRWSLRRYGFHGLSHSYAVRRAAELVGRPVDQLRIVSCHLGSGASLAAVRDGVSVDTTMGFTPVEGLVMATRSGSVDPGLLVWLLRHTDIDADELDDAVEHLSGLKGLSGTSGDMREILEARDRGDDDAALAFDVFVHGLRREIGAMAASAGGLDLLLFTGGVGEHLPQVRTSAAEGLGHLGIRIDPATNAEADADRDLSADDARVRTLVVSASEETEIARETERVLAG